MSDRNDERRRSIPWWQLTAIIIAVGGISAFALYSWFGNPRIGHRNYSLIQPGMSPSEVRDLFGCEPAFDFHELGLVFKFEGEGSYAINVGSKTEELRKRGFEQCRRQQWQSPEVTISVVYDASDKVICRYKVGGQRTRFQQFWDYVSSKFK